ncbi:MAG: GNAT family N-acetyltransferase [Propionibacteriaceae bacterium]|jgi:GNAT superfamily N-acetyltransferase|nr:GNAT family N-acetyltransferase [Propionibacteriaceae bacterium]
MSWTSELLAEHHQLAEFSCGKPELAVWLASHARRAQRQGTARVYVWADPDSGCVVGYYALAPTAVGRAGLPRSATGGVSTIPGHLIAKLALDQSIQGQGLGTALLLDAIEVVVEASRRAGGRLIVVDAIDSAAASFYAAHGFRRLADTNRWHITVAQAASLTGTSQDGAIRAP